jgi:hypothetical protein
MLRKLFLLLVMVTVIIPFTANADPPLSFEAFQPTPDSYIWYDDRTYADDSLSRKVGGWVFVVEWLRFDNRGDLETVIDRIKKIEFTNNTTGFEAVFYPDTLQRDIWFGNHQGGAYLFLGNEVNALGGWTATITDNDGNKYAKNLSLTENEIHVPKPPFVQILHTEPYNDGTSDGTLITFNAPSTDFDPSKVSIRLRIMTEEDDDGFRDDCIKQYKFLDLPGAKTFFVPYSGSEIEGRMEYRYKIDGAIGVSRTVTYFDFPELLPE